MIDASNYRLTETATSESIREIMLLRGLVLEATTGMRLTAKAPKCSTIVRKEYGFRGNHERLAEQLRDDMLTRGVLEEVTR
jgi:hypothetical protein